MATPYDAPTGYNPAPMSPPPMCPPPSGPPVDSVPTAMPPYGAPLGHQQFAPPVGHMPMTVTAPPLQYAQRQSKPGYPTWVKTVILIVSILKALPLILVMLLVLVFSNLLREYDAQYDEAVGTGMAIIAVVLLIPLAGLLLQTIGALAGRATLFIASAAVVSLIDLIIVLGSIYSLTTPNTEVSGAFLVFSVIGLQWAALVGGLKNRPTS